MLEKWIVPLAFILLIQNCETTNLEDRTTLPKYPGSALEKVIQLDRPPGNISASSDGRIFFSFFPQGSPPIKVAELKNGHAIAFPNQAFQKNFNTVLSVRADDKSRLWTLDYGNLGIGSGPKIYAFDIATGAVIHEYSFPSDIAPKDSLFNDMQVDTVTETIYITDTSPIIPDPGLVVYDIATKKARRLLKGHVSVTGERNEIVVNGSSFEVAGVPIIFNADSIALDQNLEWLYFAPFTSGELYRAKTADLRNKSLTAAQLAEKVEQYSLKTMSDGISLDLSGNIYVTDAEHSAVNLIDPNTKALTTLFKDPSFRWPDGFSYAPDGYMYLTCSALNEVFLQTDATILSRGPYYIYRFHPEASGIVGR
ncbi:L-dopachrome tautomerase-related protein [Leptospira wolffii]|uniref:L-dopachrome tautomerase-related protein n=1 Tax=Leptospira wolffii TaxID=409998 RepID=UPI0002DC10D8|nr:L-dopachrome tautomerase-related protein [Leptospira wolffii]EPG66295.1 major royal jelly protein [Leptospira wolffii serovar Khorat str. Khorat-H2]